MTHRCCPGTPPPTRAEFGGCFFSLEIFFILEAAGGSSLSITCTMEKSRLPVFRAKASNIAAVSAPSAKQPCLPKPSAPLCIKHPNIASFSVAPNSIVSVAGGNGNKPVQAKRKARPPAHGNKPVQAKRKAPPAHGPAARYRTESELKDKIQLLEAANMTLHNNVMTLHDKLAAAQNTIQELSGQQESLKGEVRELQRRQDQNLIIMESRNIDPVSGDRIIAAAEKSSKVREEKKAIAEKLLTELKSFTLASQEQRQLLQTVNVKFKEAAERRNLFLQEKEALQSELDQF